VRRFGSLLFVWFLSSACAGGQARVDLVDTAPAPSEIAKERTEIAYRSHVEILHTRQSPDEPVPLGGRIIVRVVRASPARADFDAIHVIVDDGGMEVLDAAGRHGEPASICGEDLWCNELAYDIEKPVVGPLHVTVIDTRTGERVEGDFQVNGATIP
jgi:hypothetical protein